MHEQSPSMWTSVERYRWSGYAVAGIIIFGLEEAHHSDDIAARESVQDR